MYELVPAAIATDALKAPLQWVPTVQPFLASQVDPGMALGLLANRKPWRFVTLARLVLCATAMYGDFCSPPIDQIALDPQPGPQDLLVTKAWHWSIWI